MGKINTLIAIAIAILQVSYAQSTDLLTPTDDTQLNQAGNGTPLGAQSNLLIRPWTSSYSSRSAIKFDLSAYSGCTIDNAWLVLSERNTYGISRTIDVHRLTTNWDESTAHWNFPWNTGGGDFIGTPESSFTPVWTGVVKKDSVDLTESVQDIADGINTNYGWLLKIDSEDASQQYWEYYSKEWSKVSERPVLKISASCNSSLLPIELIGFNVQKVDDKVKLEWQTASEVNNDYFTIERSENGIDWEEVKRVDGAGKSTSFLNYSTFDENPLSGVSYYRLKQTDFDDKRTYSQVKSVVFNNILDNTKIEVYPNPADVMINITGSESELNELRIYNAFGGDVTGLTQVNTKSDTKLEVNISSLTTGIYFVKTKSSTNKIYKQ